ncbi:hypothetical protein ACFX2G_030016 [Malus domestica]
MGRKLGGGLRDHCRVRSQETFRQTELDFCSIGACRICLNCYVLHRRQFAVPGTFCGRLPTSLVLKYRHLTNEQIIL